eukprot:2932910-Lingulodinium_polyedra.AAC.1
MATAVGIPQSWHHLQRQPIDIPPTCYWRELVACVFGDGVAAGVTMCTEFMHAARRADSEPWPPKRRRITRYWGHGLGPGGVCTPNQVMNG